MSKTAGEIAKKIILKNQRDITGSRSLRYPQQHDEMDKFFYGWIAAFRGSLLSYNYPWLVKPIQDKFRFRCMQDAMQEMESRAPEPCHVKAAMRLSFEFCMRQNDRVTSAPNPPPSMPPEELTLDEEALVEEAIKDVKKETLEHMIVDFLAALTMLPKLGRKDKKMAIECIGWELWLETKDGVNRGKQFASGTWTSILCALLTHKHLQFKFDSFNTNETKGSRAFVLLTLGAIVRMDDVRLLKKWLVRGVGASFDAILDNALYTLADLAVDMSMRFAAFKCYTYMCCTDDWVVAHRNERADRLKLITQNRASAVACLRPEEDDSMLTYPELAPPMQPAMLTLMWNELGHKPALDKPLVEQMDDVDWGWMAVRRCGLRKQWIHHRLFEVWREGLKAWRIVDYWQESAAKTAGFAAFEPQDDGDEGPQRSVMVGHAAAACFDELARMNDKNYATNRQHAGGKKNTGLAIAEASVAAVRARIAERERLAEQERVANAVSSDESDEDEEDEEDSEPPEASDEESDGESDGEPPEASDEESGEEEAAEHAKKKQRQE